MTTLYAVDNNPLNQPRHADNQFTKSPSSIGLIALGIILMIGGAVAAGVLYPYLGYVSLSCLSAIAVGIALIVAAVRCGKGDTHSLTRRSGQRVEVVDETASSTASVVADLSHRISKLEEKEEERKQQEIRAQAQDAHKAHQINQTTQPTSSTATVPHTYHLLPPDPFTLFKEEKEEERKQQEIRAQAQDAHKAHQINQTTQPTSSTATVPHTYHLLPPDPFTLFKSDLLFDGDLGEMRLNPKNARHSAMPVQSFYYSADIRYRVTVDYNYMVIKDPDGQIKCTGYLSLNVRNQLYHYLKNLPGWKFSGY